MRIAPLRAALPMAILAATGAVLSVGLPVPALGEELLVNGGFEETDLSPWQALGGDLKQATERKAEGSYAARYVSEGSGLGQVRQEVPAGAGGRYRLSGLVLKNDSSVEWVELRIRWIDAEGNEVALDRSPRLMIDEPAFQPLSMGPLDAPSSTRSAYVMVAVQSRHAGARVYLDDMSFEEVSPPSATSTPASSPTEDATPLASATPASTVTPVPTAVPTPSHGLLVNGGFEAAAEQVPLGWQKHGGTLWQVSSPVRNGSGAGAFRSHTESTKWVHQTVAVKGGAWYYFDGYVYANDTGVAASFLRISWYHSIDGTGTALSTSDSLGRLGGPVAGFRYLTTGSVQAPESAFSARARVMLAPVSAAPATIFMDDITFSSANPATPTPEPSSTATQGSPPAASGGPRTGPSPRTGEARGAARPPTSSREPSPFSIKISEVLYDPQTEDGDAGHEWVELYNAGREAVDMEGWTITDNNSADVLQGLRLEAGDFAVVAASERFRHDWPGYRGPLAVVDDGRLGNGLSNRGDCLILRDAQDRTVDALSYAEDASIMEPPVPAVPADHSLERRPPDRDTDTAADFVDNPHPSPGFGLTGPGTTPTATLVSEVSSIAWEPAKASGGAGWWPWALAGGLVVGGLGAGTALVVRRRRRLRGRGAL